VVAEEGMEEVVAVERTLSVQAVEGAVRTI
jgi:hypothetical protein